MFLKIITICIFNMPEFLSFRISFITLTLGKKYQSINRINFITNQSSAKDLRNMENVCEICPEITQHRKILLYVHSSLQLLKFTHEEIINFNFNFTEVSFLRSFKKKHFSEKRNSAITTVIYFLLITKVQLLKLLSEIAKIKAVSIT